MAGVRDWFNKRFENYWPWRRRRRNKVRQIIPRNWPSPVENGGISSDILLIESFDLCIEQNGTLHHTDRFDVMQKHSEIKSKLVVRRGQSFKIRLNLNRPYSRTTDLLSFVFTLDGIEKPSHGHATLVGTSLKHSSFELGEPAEWGSSIDAINGNVLDILIKPAATAPIGEWRVEVDTQLVSRDGGIRSCKYPSTIYILFNPWCKDDQVYLEDEDKCEEYVLADTTLIWRGSYNRLRPSVWKLGQFEKNILDCSLLLINIVGKLSPAYRGDPVKISRILSAVANSPDDDGAILGNWTDDYSGGTPPTKWVGSVAILQQYFAKRKPVKFGQCWVFSGTLTTIARALGIPSRIVTCYASAHDTQASMTVDYFVDQNGEVMEEMNSDSIWNYHVWNEVWMERPDLGYTEGSYGGWQAVDATPQEMSEDIYRCGPASVRAVKMGEILRPYDCNFLYSEVNADKVFWRYIGPSQPLKLLRKDTLAIGQLLSTKKIGKWEREDITSSYKFSEKSKDERDTMVRALRQTNSAFSRYYLNEDFNDIYFNFELLDDMKIGEPFNVILHVKNRSSERHYHVTGQLHVETILYTGKKRENVKSLQIDQTISPNSKEIIKLEVTFDDYFKKLLDQSAFNISCMATVDETDYDYFAQDDFRVRKPDIKITLQGTPISKQEIDVIVRLTNPLPIPLRKGIFQLEGTGIENQILMKIAEVSVGGTTSATFKYIPPYAGRGSLVCKFFCKELDDVDGFLAYEVAPRPEDIIDSENEINGFNRYIERTDIIP